MSDETHEPGENEPDDASGEPEISADLLRKFIFYRELAEVYLLLDNVSASTDKTLSLDGAENGKKKLTEPNWIEEVCKIGWPPRGSEDQLASQAATLIRARDRLNTLAAPATGATIAFTQLVGGEEKGGLRRKKTERKVVFWRRWFNSVARFGMRDERAEALELPLGPGWGDKAPSRYSLANIAFPNLARPAARFKGFQFWLVIGLVGLFAATALLSWNIAVGNGLLGQLLANEASFAKISAAPPVHRCPSPKKASPSPHPVPSKAAPRSTVSPSAAPVQVAAAPPADAADATDCPAGSACDKQLSDLRDAQYNLVRWLDGWAWLGRIPGLGKQTDCSPDLPCPTVNAQWASTLLSVLAGAVLPIFYGVLGAAATVVRTLSARIRDSTLSPRHRTLFQVQLVLGAVIGGCIGLFVTPSGQTASAGPSLLGAVPLSASALCFIAGFGVEGVFLALDSLIRRVFNMPDQPKGATKA